MSDPTGTGSLRPEQNLPPMLLPQHRLTRYLRVQLEVDDGVLRWEHPRAVLGVLPLGTTRRGVPVDDVTALSIRWPVLRPWRLAVGLALLAAPLFFLRWWLAVPIMVLGVWVVVVSTGPRLEIETIAGERHCAPVCFGHQFDADLFIDAVRSFSDDALAGGGIT